MSLGGHSICRKLWDLLVISNALFVGFLSSFLISKRKVVSLVGKIYIYPFYF